MRKGKEILIETVEEKSDSLYDSEKWRKKGNLQEKEFLSCLAHSPELKYALDIPDAGGLQ